MVLHFCFLIAAVRRIHQNNIELIIPCVVQNIFQQRVVMVNFRHINTMQQHIGDAQHIRKLLLLNSVDRSIISCLIFCSFDFSRKFLQPACKKTASAAGKVRNLFANLRINHLCHKISNGTRGVELTGRTGTLQFFQNRFIDFAESMAFLIVTKV